ncbi:MAG: hypothetical protein GY865_01220 [candidate division Zixibacteria bacterium]|nr:hypothetical protein [candidate division Zixibacteria bacterium]
MTDMEKNDAESRSGQMIGGLIVLGVGSLFLLVNYDIIPPLDESWPFFMIIVGVSLIAGALFKKKKRSETEQ